VHVGVVEAVLHDAPAFVEDLRAQRLVIDFEVRGVGDLARGRVVRRAAPSSLRRPSAPAARAAGLRSACRLIGAA
jgi:hypothetical protein